MKQLIKSFIPPIAIQCFKKLFKKNIQWSGNFKSWNEASSVARGYDPDIYLDKLINIMKTVQKDEAKSERDSVLFDKITYPYPLLSNLFAVTTYFQAKSVYILDFGGSLGSLYFQNRKFLRMLPTYTWNILEQEKIINAGKQYFQSQNLQFHINFNEAKNYIKAGDIKMLILSGVLQYLEEPYKIITSLIQEFAFDAIIVDRTPFSKNNHHQIVLQKVPKEIYQTQYPCHLFIKQDFITALEKLGYQLFDEFESYCDAHTSLFHSLGFSFVRKR